MGSDDELYKILEEALDSNFDDDEEAVLRDYISDEAIEALEWNIKFFRDIPKSNLLEIFTELMFLISENEHYNHIIDPFSELRKAYEEKHPNPNKRNSKIRPTIQLKRDIKTMKNFQDMFKRLFNMNPKSDSVLVAILEDDDPFKYKLHGFYKGMKKLLNDLETEEFKIISKSNYYQTRLPKSKSNIEEFLKNIQTKYNLKGVSLELKQIKDNLPN